MRNVIFTSLVILLSVLVQTEAYGEFRLLDLDYMDFRMARFDGNRDPLTPDMDQFEYKARVATDFQLRLLEIGYWKNYIHTETNEYKVETVGWQWELGVRITDQISFFHEHHSRHRMDRTVPDYDMDGDPDMYPCEDSYGLRLQFYLNPRPQRAIFSTK